MEISIDDMKWSLKYTIFLPEASNSFQYWIIMG